MTSLDYSWTRLNSTEWTGWPTKLHLAFLSYASMNLYLVLRECLLGKCLHHCKVKMKNYMYIQVYTEHKMSVMCTFCTYTYFQFWKYWLLAAACSFAHAVRIILKKTKPIGIHQNVRKVMFSKFCGTSINHMEINFMWPTRGYSVNSSKRVIKID